ncbi:hypothetical protein FB567DRAFT_513440 [Paraphoma chrysanthemicola]|uniref:Uncharacterized protein n=1 Tax=Paraphoma chrysanthemicola TaxID=798071 RepID=A0A8K0RMC5_9PLEO|nr:hypothetical protein FB567DRAFT_513440 [Paraphoma chrysanthemicola]
MFGESVFTDGLLQDQRVGFNKLKETIINHLPAAYPNHSSTYVIKRFSIRLDESDEAFTTTAIAELEIPESLAGEGYDVVLEDEFMSTSSCYDIVDALVLLWVEVMKFVEEGKRGEFISSCGYEVWVLMGVDPFNPADVAGIDGEDYENDVFW